MGFLDRLENDTTRIFFGAKVHEEDLTYIFSDGSTLALKGVVETESYRTGAEDENEVNRSISKLARVYVPSISFTVTPDVYDQIQQPRSGLTWNVKKINKEHGMYEFVVTEGENRRRGRIR